MTEAGRAALDKLRVGQGLDPNIPWGGRSPRVLTEAYKRFRFEATSDDADSIFDDQVLDEQSQRQQYGTD